MVIKLWVPVLLTVQYPLSLCFYVHKCFTKNVAGQSVYTNQHCDVIKMRDYPSRFLGVIFPTSPLIYLICMTSHGWFLRHFVQLPKESLFKPYFLIFRKSFHIDPKNVTQLVHCKCSNICGQNQRWVFKKECRAFSAFFSTCRRNTARKTNNLKSIFAAY